MKYILETKRLRLREFDIDEDSKFIINILNSPGWLEFIGDRNVKTEEQAKRYLQNGPIKSYIENGFGLSMVETKDNRESIGICGILRRDNLDGPDIGFAFLPEFSGKGYAYEISEATLKYALEKLQLPKIYAITMANNVKSIRLIEKIGLHFIKKFNFEKDSDELLLYSN